MLIFMCINVNNIYKSYSLSTFEDENPSYSFLIEINLILSTFEDENRSYAPKNSKRFSKISLYSLHLTCGSEYWLVIS